MLTNQKNFIIISLVIIIAGLVTVIYYDQNDKNVAESDKLTTIQTETTTSASIGCNRESRLKNKPVYDRALSIIEERYSAWEESGEQIGSWYFFPSGLLNCIEIIEEDVRNKQEAEGYFVFNGADIKDNYFPIFVDKDYSNADEATNALLLIHEITHVYQFIKDYNHDDDLSCIDREVEAFYAQWKFYGIQGGEIRKSIDLRIEQDQNLHPQLQIIRSFKDGFNLENVRNKCFYGDGKDDKNCIDNYRKNEIKDLLLTSQQYKQQCEL